MDESLKNIFYDSADTLKRFIDDEGNYLAVLKCVDLMKSSLKSGGKILFFGNGGSAADAQHLAAEFVNRFTIDRAPLAAIALTTDTSTLTSIANDMDFQSIFSRQVEALGKSGDVAYGISTSGNSENVVKALKSAKELGMVTIALTGNGGGRMKEVADITITVESTNVARIQETHITIGHALCYFVER
ncbi:SIS domain-containing protein [Thermodesulfobacteriota bacterium]